MRDVVARPHDARLADRQHEVIEFRHRERLTVKNFVFEEDDRIGIADRGFQQALGVGRGVGRDHDQAGNLRIPGRVILAVLGGDARGGAVRSAEHDRGAHLSAGHIERLRRGVDDLVDRLHGEIEGHEFDDRLEPCERRADAKTGKAVFGDRRVDHALGAEFLQQSLRDLVGALIFGDLFAHHEHIADRAASPRPWRRATLRARSSSPFRCRRERRGLPAASVAEPRAPPAPKSSACLRRPASAIHRRAVRLRHRLLPRARRPRHS